MKVKSYLELMKPELTGLAVLTTLCGFYLGAAAPVPVWNLLITGLGALLVGGGAGAFNEYIEREFDALMKRTERRPLPTGRLLPAEALAFAISVSIGGLAILAVFTNLLTVVLGAITWFLYVCVYTPLKRQTPLATLIGGIPGALPPMMGWASARNSLSAESWILFAILYCWQMPHFFALAWMYRKDYARAGFRILTVIDHNGRRTARQILLFCLALIPASVAPTWIGLTGHLTSAVALLLGISFLWISILLMAAHHNEEHASGSRQNFLARRIFLASLVYLPILLVFMIVDKV